MKKYFSIVVFFIVSGSFAQGKMMQSVFFEFDKYTLANQQEIVEFVQKLDTSQIQSVQIYGYCDDRGENNYNYILSKKRVKTVKKVLVSNGLNESKIIVFEGKGRILIDKDTVQDLAEIRSRNRRVDLLIVNKKKPNYYLGLKGLYDSFNEDYKAGDHIILNNILFELGNSILTVQAKKELDKLVLVLQKNQNLEFEIRGHICCTPSKYPDAIDTKTRDRKLSVNRAKAIYHYLLSKKIANCLTYKGYGNKFPLGKGDELDRRVEFLITKK
jgi:outer membrane protein OmpA-like peptidoglycan-associated protein